jgi:hypothetical protein
MKRLLAVVVWIALAGVLSAKGATVRIVITGGDLKQALDVRSATELQSFQVWAGAGVTVSGNPQTSGFIVHWRGGTVAEPPATLPRYEVAFYAARDITAEGELA